jgi:long-subunit fatty acid transport protein
MNVIGRIVTTAGVLGFSLSAPSIAHAGGYDTPMLYSARHMGKGGTAIGYVEDPSALFHNPAGLGKVQRGEVLADFSLLVGGIHSSPGDFVGQDIDSKTTVAPFFLVGAAYRVHPMITLGVGVFPIASAGAKYKYGTGNYQDSTELFFLETTPAIAFNPLKNLRFGLGYRMTFVNLSRYQGDPDLATTPTIDFKMSGWNFAGFRAGVQWTALPWLEFGAVFRSTVNTQVTNSDGIALGMKYTDISTHFKLPAKLGFGTRADFDPFHVPLSVAVDFEYAFNSQNKGDSLEGTAADGSTTSVVNLFEWQNSQTYRLGFEYRVWHDAVTNIDRVPLRAGYVHDTQVANPQYPTAFGTPPGPTNVLTCGTGYNGGKWQANIAYAYRFGHGAVNPPANSPCVFCSYKGDDDYRIHLHGMYVDASYKF